MADYISIMTGSDLNVGGREVTEPDGVTKVHQTAVVAANDLSLPSTAQVDNVNVSADYPATPIDIRGSAYVVLKTTFTDSGQSCGIRFVLYLADQSTLLAITDEITINATDRQDGTNYLGELVVFDNSRVGAGGIKINLSTVPGSGNVSFYVGGI